MNRDELDAFFAKAEDVLTDWDGSFDSMNTAEDCLLDAILRPAAPSPDGVVTYAVSGPLFDDRQDILAPWRRRLYSEFLFVALPVRPGPLVPITGV